MRLQIVRSEDTANSSHWGKILGSTIRSFEELKPFLEPLGVDPRRYDALQSLMTEQGGIRVPSVYLEDLVESISTPLEQSQVRALIVPEQEQSIVGSVGDATTFLDDHSVDNNPMKGLTRMYPDRVLLSPTHACAHHCSWCFRDMGGGMLSTNELDAIFEYIDRDPRITDVILTGGEPLLVGNRRLRDILDSLRAIPHVDILRFHTRMLSVCPERIDDEFLDIISAHRRPGKPIYLVAQFIHPNEFSSRVIDAVWRLNDAGVMLLNQAPVLRGVTDDQDTFNRWMKTMIRHQVRPYYAISTIITDGKNSRFFVPFEEVQELVNNYSAHFDGLGRPTVIVPVMGKKVGPAQLSANMTDRGAYVRNTKSQIWAGSQDRRKT